MKSSTPRAALVLILTFAAGAAAGVAGDRLWFDGPTDAPPTADSQRAEAKDDRRKDKPKTTIERFADELGLTETQRARIEEILTQHREAVHEMWSETRPRYRALVDSARAEIEAVLSEEQTEQYRRYLRQEHGSDRDSGWGGAGKDSAGDSIGGERDSGDGGARGSTTGG